MGTAVEIHNIAYVIFLFSVTAALTTAFLFRLRILQLHRHAVDIRIMLDAFHIIVIRHKLTHDIDKIALADKRNIRTLYRHFLFNLALSIEYLLRRRLCIGQRLV